MFPGCYLLACLYMYGVVVLVKDTFLCMRVIKPPPSPVCLSCLSLVKPGNFGVLCLSLSMVSCMSAMSMLCLSKCCFISCCLLVMPSMFSCRMFMLCLNCESWFC